MSSYVRHKDKKTGITYVYESESYWDKEKKQPRNRKKLIGKIDEATGEIVPTNGRGRKKKDPEINSESVSAADLAAVEKKYAEQISQLSLQIEQKEQEVRQLRATLEKILQEITAAM